MVDPGTPEIAPSAGRVSKVKVKELAEADPVRTATADKKMLLKTRFGLKVFISAFFA
jgi:hypothetical protein